MCEKGRRERCTHTHKSVHSAEPSLRRQLHPLQCSDNLEMMKSQVRSCVMQILTERLSNPAVFSEMDNALVTELILEYLDWMGYNRTLETFRMECRLPRESNGSLLDELAQQNHLSGNVLPHIFHVVRMFKNTLGNT